MPDPTGAKPTPLAQLRDRLNRTTEIRDRIRTLVGHGESPDGLVKVSCSADEPLHGLELHPRALKLLNAELATLIEETARAARTDLKRQTQEVVAEIYGDQNAARSATGPDAASGGLGELTELMNTTGQDALAAIERMRRLLGPKG